MTASQRDKGQRGEREFCAALGEHIGETLVRQLDSARDGGPDVLIGQHWAVEVKRGETLQLATWWLQACRQASNANRWPALAYRQNRQAWTILVPLDVVLYREQMWGEVPAEGWGDLALELTAALSLTGFAAVVRELA